MQHDAPPRMCVASAQCRVLEPRLDDLAAVRLHLLVEPRLVASQLADSWLAWALRHHMLDCSSPRGGFNRLNLDLFHGFRPLGDDKNETLGELFYVMLDTQTFTPELIGQSVQLSPCGQFAATEFDCANMSTPVRWQGRAQALPLWTLHGALRAASSRAAFVFHMAEVPDVSLVQMRAVRALLQGSAKHATRRALVLHYRAGRLPLGWHLYRTPDHWRKHLSTPAGKKGLPHEGFWSTFWHGLLRHDVRPVRDAEHEAAGR